MKLLHKKYAVLLPIVFSVTLLVQCVVFHYLAFNSYLFSSIVRHPLPFWAFYLPKISICILIGSFVSAFRSKWWTILFSIIVCIWGEAQLVYYRVNNIFLDSFSFFMIGNMKGFWDSVLTFIYVKDLLLLLPTVSYTILFVIWKNDSKSYSLTAILFISGILLQLSGAKCLQIEQQDLWHEGDINGHQVFYFNPFSEQAARGFWGFTNIDYIKQTSLIHSLVYDVWGISRIPNKDSVTFSDKESRYIEQSINANPRHSLPKTPLIIILFESLESWAISPSATPNIWNLIQNNENILWAKKLIKQTKGATSADGQMIVNTGLLPINNGATCYRFPYNTYPSLSDLYNSSAYISTGGPGVWNQGKMSEAYHIDVNFYNNTSDKDLFMKLNEVVKEFDYIMIVTVDSHAPFINSASINPIIPPVSPSIPDNIRNYLNCVHNTDASMASLISQATNINSTIVITGDHTIFDKESREKFYMSCNNNEQEIYKVKDSYCPLIIYSPAITEKTIIEDEAYQMDVYPTILSLIGCYDTYWWKGVGINLLDKNRTRVFSEEEAFILSDKIIRCDYFENFVSNKIGN